MSCVNIWIHFSFESIDAPEGTAARKRPLSVAKSTWDRHGKRRHLVLHPFWYDWIHKIATTWGCQPLWFLPILWIFSEFLMMFVLSVAASMVGLPLESRISLAFSVRMKAMDPPGTTGPAQTQKNVEGPAQVTKLFELRKWLSQEMLPAKTCKVTANKKEVH